MVTKPEPTITPICLFSSGKYGDGCDVTTWKINFRCALNGLKDIVERKDLEEQDCRVYQMLPTSGSNRRRKRRRPGYFTSDMLELQSPDNKSDAKLQLDLSSPVTFPTFSLSQQSSFGPITPVSSVPTSALSPIQVLPIISSVSSMRLPIMMSPTTPQNSSLGVLMSPTAPQTSLGVLQKLVPHSSLYSTQVRTSDVGNIEAPPPRFQNISDIAHVRLHGNSSSVHSQPTTPRTPVSSLSAIVSVLRPQLPLVCGGGWGVVCINSAWVNMWKLCMYILLVIM